MVTMLVAIAIVAVLSAGVGLMLYSDRKEQKRYLEFLEREQQGWAERAELAIRQDDPTRLNATDNRRVLTAHGARWVFAKLQFPERELERVEQNQSPNECVPLAEDELERLQRLDAANDSR